MEGKHNQYKIKSPYFSTPSTQSPTCSLQREARAFFSIFQISPYFQNFKKKKVWKKRCVVTISKKKMLIFCIVFYTNFWNFFAKISKDFKSFDIFSKKIQKIWNFIVKNALPWTHMLIFIIDITRIMHIYSGPTNKFIFIIFYYHLSFLYLYSKSVIHLPIIENMSASSYQLSVLDS